LYISSNLVFGQKRPTDLLKKLNANVTGNFGTWIARPPIADQQNILLALASFLLRMPDRNSDCSIPSPSIVKLF
jgi:hypothetical protein